ncbi:MAG: FAD-dependent oxidoreductase, partial [Chloroflexi bacterium]|nr:FAD-dependent oxidoreductase [Chloroflexota bacterium]
SVGGRLATRRIANGRADHGAQFFTVRTAEFERFVSKWRQAGVVYQWSNGWSDGSLDKRRPDGHPRYAVHGGLNQLAQHLAQDLDTRVNTRVASIRQEGERWEVITDDSTIFRSRSLILTPPVPQSLELLDAGNTQLKTPDRVPLENISYAPCICGMFHVEGRVTLPDPGALQRPYHPISWIADNQRKGISPDARIVTVHAGHEYSNDLWDKPDDVALAAIRDGLTPFLAPSAKILEGQLKRWRYAFPIGRYHQPTLIATDLAPLAFAGDAFAGPRVEGAVRSGLAAADAIATRLVAVT